MDDVAARVLLPRGALGRVRADDARGNVVEGGAGRRPRDVYDAFRFPAEQGAREECGEDLGGGLRLGGIEGLSCLQCCTGRPRVGPGGPAES